MIVAAGATKTKDSARDDWALRQKIIAETAMLLLCVEPVRGSDQRIREQFESLAALLIPQARHEDVICALCLDPGLAWDHSVAHVILRRLGFPNPNIDRLLSDGLAMGPDFGPERTPVRRLEREWLARLWNMGKRHRHRKSRHLADSMLGKRMDVLGSSRLDIYAFTHAVMYASDLGGRRVKLARSRASIGADADASLAYSLDSNDFDLTAELLLTWPMLGLAWSPTATFAFRILTSVQDNVGVLPGLAFDLARYRELKNGERMRFGLTTSYHTTYVMGFLCAAALRRGRGPPPEVACARRSTGAGSAIERLIGASRVACCWEESFRALSPRQKDSVASFSLTALLRRARTAGDLRLLRQALEVAVTHNVALGPAPTQAAALLRRSIAIEL
jgi:hypothetical protein